MSKPPLLCRLGLHETFADSVGTNVGTAETPMWFFDTYETCDRCGWTTRPKTLGDEA